ncbi:MAG: two-component regulator propeller domain-containing protein [Bacteroidota bacterium]
MKKTFLFLLFLCGIVTAQNIGEWVIYADLKNLSDIVYSSNSVWCATNGGVFRYNYIDGNFTIHNKANGFNSQSITTNAVDSQNKIWFGSDNGYIIIYNENDGTTTNILDIVNSNKSIKSINDIFVSGDTIFVSSAFGLSILNADDFSFYDTFIKLGNFPSESNIISSFKTNLVYAVTDYGVAIQKQDAQNLSAPESWDTYEYSTSIVQNDIPAQSGIKIVNYNSTILLASNKGVISFIDTVWQPFLLEGINIADIKSQENKLYIITDHQLYVYEGTHLTLLYENYDTEFTSIDTAGNNVIYIATTDGLIEFDSTQSLVKNVLPEGPAGNRFVNLAVAKNGKLYVSTGKDGYGIGFMEFDGLSWNLYNKQEYPQIASNDYYNVYAGSDDKIYLSNWGYGISIFDGTEITTYKKDNSPLVGIPSNPDFIAISDIKLDSKGNAWIVNVQSGARTPLNVKTLDNSWYSFAFTDPIISETDILDKMVIDQYDTKWFFTIQGRMGLYYFNENGTFTNTSDDDQGYISTNDGLLSNDISSLAVDKRGYLWIGTNIGLNLITDPSRPISTLTSSIAYALRNQTVTCIAVDPIDRKWIGTKQGLFVLGSDGFELIAVYNTDNSPIPNNDIKSIAIDPRSGKVYIGTDNGLAVLITEAIEPQESFGELFIYPNPFIIGSNGGRSITIDGLIEDTSLKIFDINGNLIRTILSPGGRVAFWDGKDSSGNFVASGIYIVVAYDREANNVANGKVAVIKK